MHYNNISIKIAVITVTTPHPIIDADFYLYHNRVLVRFPWSNDVKRKMRQKAIVIDLDCTLLTINTFKSYILYVNKLSYRKGRIDISFFLTMWVLLRKCRIISHEYMKYQILKCTEHFMKEKSLKDFTNLIIKHLNKN